MSHPPETPGPWQVTSTASRWLIVNTETGCTKVIGPVTQPRSKQRTNYFDRAVEEADRRNRVLQQRATNETGT